jgi:hypothetical protein
MHPDNETDVKSRTTGQHERDRSTDAGKRAPDQGCEEDEVRDKPRRISQKEMQKYVPQDPDPDDPVSP